MKMKAQEKFLMKLLVLILVMLLVMIPIAWEKTFAASSSVSISDGEPDVGDSFTVTIYYTGDSFGSVDGALTYDSSVLRYEDCTAQANGGNGEVSFSNYQTTGDETMAVTFYFTVIGSGTSTVTAYSSDIYNYDGDSLGGATASASFAAGGTAAQTTTSESESESESQEENRPKSSNANLSHFSIACGEISPAFSPEITSYSVTAGPTETNVDITAIPESEYADVEFGGSPVLTQNEVTRVVTVIAEDGTRKEYSIKITRSNPSGAIVYNGALYVPTENQNLSDVPAGFIASKINYSGKEMNILKSRDGNVNIVRLMPDGGSDSDASWFVFNPESQSFVPSEIVTVDGNKYVVVKSGVNLVYGGAEGASGFQIYDGNSGKLSSVDMSGAGAPELEPVETPEEQPQGETTPSETTPTPEETPKKGKGLLWLILLLILALIVALAYMFLRDRLGKKNRNAYSTFGEDDEEDDDDVNSDENRTAFSLAGLKGGLSSKFGKKNSNDIFSEESGMSERRIARRRRIAEAEAREAEALAAGAAAASVASSVATETPSGPSPSYVDSTPISEGSVVTKAELEAAKIAAAEKAREEALRAAEEARAAQEAAAAAIAARDAARAAKARVASSELDSAMEELLEVGEELHSAVNKKDE